MHRESLMPPTHSAPSRWRRTLTVCALAASCLCAPLSASADDDDRLSDLSAQWWQWALSLPNTGNPLNEMNRQGLACGLGQRGPYWFLGGLSGSSGTVERQCTLPEGVTIFFPVVNTVFIDTPGVCGQTDDQGQPFSVPVADMRAGTAGFIDGVTEASVTIDGKAVRFRRLKSKVFSATLPLDNLFLPVCVSFDLTPPPAGVYSPAVDDGLYASIDRLPPGKHVLKFKVAVSEAASPPKGFNLDVTYHLNVVPVKLK